MDNNATVTHPQTRYASLSDMELTALYRESSWYHLDEASRRDLLQETVNREAVANGNKYSCNVVFEDMSSNCSGYQSGDKMALNREMFVHDRISYQYGERTITYNLPDSNYRAMEVVHHEHQHVLQNNISDGTVQADSQTKALFESNNFTVSDVSGQNGSQYMLGKTGYHMYYLNPTELDAHRVSQDRTRANIEALRGAFGNEASMTAYLDRMSAEGYEAKLNEYKAMFQNENVDAEVAQVLQNKFNNTDVPVDRNIENAVEKEMIASYNEIYSEENKMSTKNWADLHVSREEYDASLRSTVNSVYTHEMSDPSVSREEGIETAAQTAENYHTAMEEFDAAQAQVQAESSATEEGAAAATDEGTSTASEGNVASSAEGVTSASTEGGTSGGTDGGADDGADGGASGGTDGGIE